MNQNTTLTKTEIVVETLAFYGMGGEFSADKRTGSCCYHQPETGRMCAVGRCLTPDSVPEEFYNSSQLDELDLDYVEDFQPPYQGHEVAFWGDLQRVHDTAALYSVGCVGFTGSSAPYMALRSINNHYELELPLDDPEFRLLYPAFFYSVR